MNQLTDTFAATPGKDQSAHILKIAILAVGGQGGGVLSNWIADLAERGGYSAQMTSVAGVAQRTGATVYYIEMAPKSDLPPVFALSPTPGDLDVVIASELMEAGRAVLRGFVTQDKTTLIASDHRILAISEKEVPGDGRSDRSVVRKSIQAAAHRLVCFDMEALALASGSVISASLFGALARSKALPFAVDAFEEVIRASGRGVETSLQAFRAALDYVEADTPPDEDKTASNTANVTGPESALTAWNALCDRIPALPSAAQDYALAGLRKTVDYQDVEYGAEYLDRLQPFMAPKHDALAVNAAKYIANAMCYDDILRVADLKTRETRDQRLRREQQIDAEAVVHVTEYFHPRIEEIVSILTPKQAAWVENRGWARKLIGWMAGDGKRIRTDRIRGFSMLWLIASRRSKRRKLLRHQIESAHLDRLSSTALKFAQTNPALAAELLACQRLIKGYSDTHTRGHSKFDRVFHALALIETRTDSADWVRRLRTAALADEKGDGLDQAIQTIRSFADQN